MNINGSEKRGTTKFLFRESDFQYIIKANLCIDNLQQTSGFVDARSNVSAISSESSILGTVIFSLADNASGSPFSAAKGMNCFARSSMGILFLGLFPTFVSSNLMVTFSCHGAFFQVHAF